MADTSSNKRLRNTSASAALRLWQHLGKHKPLYVLGIITAAFDAAAQSMIPMVFRFVINELQIDAKAFFDGGAIWTATWFAIAISTLFFVAALTSHVARQISIARFARDLQQRLYEHVQKLSADFFHRNRVGEISARTGSDIEAVSQSLSAIGGLIYKCVMILFSTAMMFWISWRLTPVFIVLILIVSLLSRTFLPSIKRISRRYRNALGETNAAITEFLGIHELIRSYSGEEQATERVEQHIDQSRKQAEKLAWQTSLFSDTLQLLIGFVGPFVLLFVSAWFISREKLAIGDVVAYWSYWLIMGGMVNQVLATLAVFYTGLASVDRVYEFLDERPLIEDEAHAVELTNVQGHIALKDVCFNYPADSDQQVLNHVSLEIPIGHTAAFVGPSGAGKSTILQLVMRFYDPKSGSVQIDGQDLRNFTQSSLRKSIGMVMQESVFFSGTIAQNMRFAKPNATREEMIAALKNANAWQFVEEFPNQLDTVIGERGARLSGGQKQRLSIARVFLKNPPIVIFDEATSALDSISEKQVQAAMQKLMAGRTTLVVAHRISTIKQADEIFIVEDGQISASGPHDHLIEKSPLYYDLYSHQAG